MGVSDKVEVLLRAVEITEKKRLELASEIHAAKAKEWRTVHDEKRGVRVLSPQETQRVRTFEADRILPSRFVVTPKTEDGETYVKARWVLRGDKDPDAIKLNQMGQVTSPTVSQNGRMLAL